jgi:hypothetical protein
MVTEIELSESGVRRSSHHLLRCIGFLFVGQMKKKFYKKKKWWIQKNELLACILDAAASIKKCAHLLKQHVIFAHELQI